MFGLGLVLTIFGLIAAIKLHSPDFLGSCEWLTYGRVHPIFIDAFIYGWGNNAVFAVGLWVMARLCGTRVRHMGILYVAGAFWNLGVLWGIVSILLGAQTSVAWLDMPMQVGLLLVFSYGAIAVWGILCFHYRQAGSTYVSQWYLLAALFWFGWIYFVAQLMVLYFPVRGVVQSIVDAWYVNNVMDLWFTPVAVAVTYYLLPKILGKPLAGYYLAILGFWAYALFASWAGMKQLVWGPVPVWLHMLRGMALSGSEYPFASVDSTDVARNHNRPHNDALQMALRWDGKQCPARWTYREQLELAG